MSVLEQGPWGSSANPKYTLRPTREPMRAERKGRTVPKSPALTAWPSLWHYVSGHLEPIWILCEYQPGRLGGYASGFLKRYSGCLQTERCSGYKKVPGVTRAGCYAPARRKLVDVIKAMGKETAGFRVALAFAGPDYHDRLFKLERESNDMIRRLDIRHA